MNNIIAKRLVLLLLVSTLLVPSNAYAYLDPGSGSMILQLLLAGFAGLMVLLRTYWHQISLKFFGRKRSDDDDVEDKNSDNGQQ